MTSTTSTSKKSTTTTKAVTKVDSTKAKDQTDAKEQARLDGLVSAVKTGFATISGQQSKVVEAVSIAIQLAEVRDNARVATARALAELAKHPATFAQGKQVGALSKIATLVGMPRNTLRPLFDGAMALTEKKWERRTSVPTAAERALVASFYGDEVLRKQEAAEESKSADGDSKGKKSPNTKEVKKIQATLEGVVSAADVLDQTVAAFLKGNGLTKPQFEALQTKIGNILVALEKSVPEASTK